MPYLSLDQNGLVVLKETVGDSNKGLRHDNVLDVVSE